MKYLIRVLVLCLFIIFPVNSFTECFLIDLRSRISAFFNQNEVTLPKKKVSNFKEMHEKIMNYPMSHVLARYKKDFKVSDEFARIHERELKRYFIMCGSYPNESLDMWSPEVDNLWHTFILYTKDYKKFCEETFGYFLHHCPTE